MKFNLYVFQSMFIVSGSNGLSPKEYRIYNSVKHLTSFMYQDWNLWKKLLI